MSSQVIGYYRCSDILFNALPDGSREAEALSGALSERALIHPDHPLHKKGVNGINTFLGKFADGKLRYLFSSAQVEYLRYWLHAMNIADLIPLPSSESMFLASEVDAEPTIHTNMKSLRNAMKKIKKINSKLEGADTSLTSRRDTFERVRKLWDAQAGVFLALDFELWTGDHTQNTITEMGYSSVRWEDRQEKVERGHFTVEEHRFYRNGQYNVPERRENYNPWFGQSVELTKAELKAKVSDLISGMRIHGPVFLVFHDTRGDIRTLNGLSAPIETAVYELPNLIPAEGIFILDTQILFGGLTGRSKEQVGLGTVCNQLGIQTEFLHNAGNDAEYTLQALREMASGESWGIQAARRWPSSSSATGGVEQNVPYDSVTGALDDSP
ncbi:hypothetical protein B0H16DRAFT_1539250 [Mycena metata]|uniref:Gfd2/YDR514C-like C-terminal domain-containing protein n=1 Tax=Mycena metata TaxID=1033252 RepID=A0AAD7J3L8_9AGAR|nr:hypothetical protein B0H16DRAFT_1539250 [Mycena metata]